MFRKISIAIYKFLGSIIALVVIVTGVVPFFGYFYNDYDLSFKLIGSNFKNGIVENNFKLENTGLKSISRNDIFRPIGISCIGDKTRILNANIEKSININSSLKIDNFYNKIIIDFDLLNPDENIEILIYSNEYPKYININGKIKEIQKINFFNFIERHQLENNFFNYIERPPLKDRIYDVNKLWYALFLLSFVLFFDSIKLFL